MQVPNLSLQRLPSGACCLKRFSMDLHASASFPVIVRSRKRKLLRPLDAPDNILPILGTLLLLWIPFLFLTLLVLFFKDFICFKGLNELVVSSGSLFSIGTSTSGSISMLSRIHFDDDPSPAAVMSDTFDTMKQCVVIFPFS